MESIKLIEPTPELKREFAAMAKEWQAAGDDRYLEELALQKDATVLPDDRVPQTTYWLVSATEQPLGVSKLRHWLLPHLEKRGGHIGYEIRPIQVLYHLIDVIRILYKK